MPSPSWELRIFPSKVDLSFATAMRLAEKIEMKPDSLFCLAAGGSPEQAYRDLAEILRDRGIETGRLKILKLDEWLGLPVESPGSCERFLKETIINPLGIAADRYFSFSASPDGAEDECRRIDSLIDRHGPIDCAVLGLGMNGHIGFNEPGEFLSPDTHAEDLSAESLQHPMVRDLTLKPTKGITVGMRHIMASREILLTVHGKHKKDPLARLLMPRIASRFPASILHLHPRMSLFADEAALRADMDEAQCSKK